MVKYLQFVLLIKCFWFPLFCSIMKKKKNVFGFKFMNKQLSQHMTQNRTRHLQPAAATAVKNLFDLPGQTHTPHLSGVNLYGSVPNVTVTPGGKRVNSSTQTMKTALTQVFSVLSKNAEFHIFKSTLLPTEFSFCSKYLFSMNESIFQFK